MVYHNCLRTFAIVLILGIGIGIGSQLPLRDQVIAKDGDQAKPKQLRSLKMGVVNVAKVLKEFDKAEMEGNSIAQCRQGYIDEVKPLREDLAQLGRDIANARTEDEKKRIREKSVKLNRQIEDIDREAQKELSHLSDQVIVDTSRKFGR